MRVNAWKLMSMLLVCGVVISAKAQMPSVDNFHQVSPQLYRSAQPTQAQMSEVEKFGIKTVLNLREFHSDETEAAHTGLVLKRVAMNAGHITDHKVVQALREIRSAEKPVLVHCWHGSDRTGVVVALYRLVFEGATKDDVITELKMPEYGYHERWYPNVIRYIRDVDVEKIKQQVLLP